MFCLTEERVWRCTGGGCAGKSRFRCMGMYFIIWRPVELGVVGMISTHNFCVLGGGISSVVDGRHSCSGQLSLQGRRWVLERWDVR